MRTISRVFCYFLGILTFVCLVVGCKPKPTTNPKAPKESYNFSKSQVENRRYVSTLNLPVDITFAEIERQLNTQIPDLIYEDGNFDDGDDLICKVWKRGRLTAGSDGTSGFRLGVPLRVWLRVRYRVLGLVTEKETEFEVNVHLRTAFGRIFVMMPSSRPRSSRTRSPMFMVLSAVFRV